MLESKWDDQASKRVARVQGDASLIDIKITHSVMKNTQHFYYVSLVSSSYVSLNGDNSLEAVSDCLYDCKNVNLFY